MKRSSWRVLLLVLCALVTGLYLAREPFLVYRDQRDQARQAEEDMRRHEAERAELIREKANVDNSVGKEELAREQGYVRKGEVRMGPDGP